MPEPAKVLIHNNPCPRCGGDRANLESACRTCRWHPGAVRLPPSQQAVVTLQMLTASAKTTSISSMFLLTAIVAACASAGTQHVALGIIASVISLLAVARTSLFVLYSKAHGEQISLGRKLESFTGNFVLMTLFLVVTLISFFAVCILVTIATHNFILATLLALLLSLAIFVRLLWLVSVYA